MMTPKKIQELAEPIEAVYANIVDELLINIAKHVKSPTWTHTAVWEVQKLSEMGQLTAENAAIINKWIKELPQELRDTMEATRLEALKELEKQMEAAMNEGYVTPPLADSTERVLCDLSEQAAERLNLVNTTMLQSSLDQYARAIQLTAEDVERAEKTQQILNEAAGSAVSGAETRRQAVRRAITRIADEGLTGFVDRAGRHWTPEAYVNMDVRTTVHNVSIQATRARMGDYGTNVFQVSSHAGARPGCYPYQGKFYSWDNTAGEIPLGNGGSAHYEPINSTTYGQAAGLFGINCGHSPNVIIPGYSIPHGADNIQPKAENDKAYAESQQQRALERKIREEKRRVEMLGSTATKEDRERVRQAQKRMKEFINTTGRTRRPDREQIVKTSVETLRKRWDRDFDAKYKATTKENVLKNADKASGIEEKLIGYALNSEHPVGKNKAIVFEAALGYNTSNAKELSDEIRKGIKDYIALPSGDNGHGEKFNVIIPVKGANGNIQPVQTGWIFDEGKNEPRMVTAYVHKKLHRP